MGENPYKCVAFPVDSTIFFHLNAKTKKENHKVIERIGFLFEWPAEKPVESQLRPLKIAIQTVEISERYEVELKSPKNSIELPDALIFVHESR